MQTNVALNAKIKLKLAFAKYKFRQLLKIKQIAKY